MNNISSVAYLSKPITQSNHDKTSDKPKLRNFPQNNWPILFKSTQVWKTEEGPQTEGDMTTKRNMESWI